MAVEFLGTAPEFLGTRCPRQKFLATLRSPRNVRYEIHFKVETARTSTLAGVRRLLVLACRLLLVLRNFALHVDHLHSLLPENVPKLQQRLPRKERLSREITPQDGSMM